MNLVSLLEQRAAGQPDTPALIDSHHGQDRVVSYAELAKRVSAGSSMLESIGLRKGMTILAFHPVSIEPRKFLCDCCTRRQPDAFLAHGKPTASGFPFQP